MHIKILPSSYYDELLLEHGDFFKDIWNAPADWCNDGVLPLEELVIKKAAS